MLRRSTTFPPRGTPALPLVPVPTRPADALKTCFRDVFGCRGREFGSLSRGVLGISDGNEGVQWNAGYYPRDGAVWLGVNLEGMKYDDWPVALDRLDGQGWEDALRGARECLNPRKQHPAARRFRSRCSLRNGTLGNDRLRWM